MLLSDFNYHLPQDRIAQEPAHPRDHAKLMLINRSTGEISHHNIYDLPNLIPSSYFLVANNTKVFPARLLGHKPTGPARSANSTAVVGGGKVEILLTSPLGHSSYHCIARPGLKIGDVVVFDKELTGTITHISDIERTIHFNQEESTLRTTLSEIGSMPTPPYIKKLLGNSSDYQTIYAKYGFSAAAPTAGLHFTPELLQTIKRNFSWNELTLNVGLGTFLPVKEDKVEDHHMHSESYTISPTTAANINLQRSDLCKKLLAIGTTTMRALESCPTLQGSVLCNQQPYLEVSSQLQRTDPCNLAPGTHTTSIFIYPPYRFRQVDALLTNFHLPRSSLLVLVAAFAGRELVLRAYRHAVRAGYRFYSYGDATLIV